MRRPPRPTGRACAGIALLVAGLAGTGSGAAHESAAPRQDFVPPAPGSYVLPVIGRAPDGPVLDSGGQATRLSRYVRGKVTLLGFIYTYCSDPLGCPLTHDAFVTLRERLLARAELARQVRLVSFSLDPGNDTPEVMRAFGGSRAASAAVEWRFLTAPSRSQLAPLLASFGQDVNYQADPRGGPARVASHLLRVFLLDRQGRIREIYSPAFLLPEVILNDMETLLREAPPAVP